MTNVKPMTPEQVKQTLDNTNASIDKSGLWNKVCNKCGASVGGRLAEYGRPTDDEMRYCCCPNCDNDGEHEGFRIEYIAPKSGVKV